MKQRLTAIAIAVVAFFGLMVVASPSASAATVYQCVNFLTCNAQIAVTTGAKDLSNHTQWVGSITLMRKDNRYALHEAWAGNGSSGVAWYRSTYTSSSTVTWTINQWIKNGSGICGAWTQSDGSRAIACITIRA